MTRASIGAVVLAAALSSEAWAQQNQPPQAQDREELRQMCREEVRKQCSFVLPSQSAILRCVAESPEKFSKPCLAMFAGGETDAPPRREDNRN